MFIRLRMSTTAFLLLFLLCLGSFEARIQGSDGSESIAKSFIDLLRNAIKINRMDIVKDIILDSFLFEGCNKYINKRELLKILGNVPDGTKLSFAFKSSHFIDSNRKQIGFTIATSGLGENLKGNFVLDSNTDGWKLASGSMPVCQKIFDGHHHQVIVNSPEPIARGFLRGLRADVDTDGSEEIAQPFVVSLGNFIGSQDQIKLSAIISDQFVFYGCKGSYNKTEALAMIDKFPRKFSLTFKNSKWFDIDEKDGISCIVVADGFGTPIEANFAIQKENGVFLLVGGWIPNCGAGRFVARWY